MDKGGGVNNKLYILKTINTLITIIAKARNICNKHKAKLSKRNALKSTRKCCRGRRLLEIILHEGSLYTIATY